MKNKSLIKRIISVLTVIILTASCFVVDNWVSNISAYEWSSWSTTYPTQNNIEIQSKKEYRYKDRLTKKAISMPQTPEGYSYEGSSKINEYTAWGGWSAWSTAAKSSNSLTDVGTTTGYRYYAFRCSNCGTRDPYSGTCSGCGRNTLSWIADYDTVSGYSKGYDKVYNNAKARVYWKSAYWYFELNGTSDGQGGTGQPRTTMYRYRTRQQYSEYHYWPINFTNWSATALSPSESRVVETRTVYRYRLKSASLEKVTTKKTKGKTYLYNISNKSSNKKTSKKRKRVFKIKKAKSTKKKRLYVKWTSVKGATGYQVYLSKTKHFNNKTYKKNYKKKRTKFTAKGLKSGSVFYIKVRTYQKRNGVKKFGKWTKVKRVKIK